MQSMCSQLHTENRRLGAASEALCTIFVWVVFFFFKSSVPVLLSEQLFLPASRGQEAKNCRDKITAASIGRLSRSTAAYKWQQPKKVKFFKNSLKKKKTKCSKMQEDYSARTVELALVPIPTLLRFSSLSLESAHGEKITDVMVTTKQMLRAEF